MKTIKDTPRHWRPLVRATELAPPRPELVAETMRLFGLDEAAARAHIDRDARGCAYWVNDLYQVEVRDHGDMWQVNVRRRDGAPGVRDWRHFQQIKNEVVGAENEGYEVYPAESRKVDTANKYHLWVFKDPARRLPFGYAERDVSYDDFPGVPGLRQRPL